MLMNLSRPLTACNQAETIRSEAERGAEGWRQEMLRATCTGLMNRDLADAWRETLHIMGLTAVCG